MFCVVTNLINGFVGTKRMEKVTVNLYGIPIWFCFCWLGYWAIGWQLQHVWHFHPFIRWFVGHFWQAVLVASISKIAFNTSENITVLYFMCTLLFLSWLRRHNPIDPAQLLQAKPNGSLSAQDAEACWLAFFHLVALGAIL